MFKYSRILARCKSKLDTEKDRVFNMIKKLQTESDIKKNHNSEAALLTNGKVDKDKLEDFLQDVNIIQTEKRKVRINTYSLIANTLYINKALLSKVSDGYLLYEDNEQSTLFRKFIICSVFIFMIKSFYEIKKKQLLSKVIKSNVAISLLIFSICLLHKSFMRKSVKSILLFPDENAIKIIPKQGKGFMCSIGNIVAMTSSKRNLFDILVYNTNKQEVESYILNKDGLYNIDILTYLSDEVCKNVKILETNE